MNSYSNILLSITYFITYYHMHLFELLLREIIKLRLLCGRIFFTDLVLGTVKVFTTDCILALRDWFANLNNNNN